MDVSNRQRIADLPRLLRLLAAHSASELNLSSLAGDAEIPVRTLPPYLDLLETLYLVGRIPAWSTNLSKRIVDRPKILLLDSGLAARLVNVSPTGAGPNANPDAAGAIVETFVISELRRQLRWSEHTPRLFHYRDRDGAEVDLILETADGLVAAIEIKSAATLRGKDTRLDHPIPRQSRSTFRRRPHSPHRPTSPAIRRPPRRRPHRRPLVSPRIVQ